MGAPQRQQSRAVGLSESTDKTRKETEHYESFLARGEKVTPPWRRLPDTADMLPHEGVMSDEQRRPPRHAGARETI